MAQGFLDTTGEQGVESDLVRIAPGKKTQGLALEEVKEVEERFFEESLLSKSVELFASSMKI